MPIRSRSSAGLDTITLDSPLPTITDNLTITGQDASNLSIQAVFPSSEGSIISIAAGSYTGVPPEVTITDLTLRGNNSTPAFAVNGGGIYADSGVKLHLADMTITENQAIFDGEGGGYGGGLYVGLGATVDLTRVTVTDNQADRDGGGIYLSDGASLTITDSADQR